MRSLRAVVGEKLHSQSFCRLLRPEPLRDDDGIKADACSNAERKDAPRLFGATFATKSLWAGVLLPVQGSGTQWYKNVLKRPSIRVDARGVGAEFRATPVTDAKAVKSVVEKLREKYGAKDVKKYYSKFDVAVMVQLT